MLELNTDMHGEASYMYDINQSSSIYWIMSTSTTLNCEATFLKFIRKRKSIIFIITVFIFGWGGGWGAILLKHSFMHPWLILHELKATIFRHKAWMRVPYFRNGARPSLKPLTLLYYGSSKFPIYISIQINMERPYISAPH